MAGEIVTIQIKGAEDIARALKAMPPAMRGPTLATALRAGATLVKKAYQQRIPIRKTLRGGWKNHPPGTARRAVRIWTVRTGDQNWSDVQVGASNKAFYMRFLEFGTKYITPRGYLRQAYAEQEANVLPVIAGVIWLKLQVVAAKLSAQQHP